MELGINGKRHYINLNAIRRSIIAFIKVIILKINLNSGIFEKRYPPEAVRNKEGMVAAPNSAMAKAAKIGCVIVAAIRNAAYKSPQGINPKIIPSA